MTSTIAGMQRGVNLKALLDARFDESVRPQDARIVLFQVVGDEPQAERPALAAAKTPYPMRGIP